MIRVALIILVFSASIVRASGPQTEFESGLRRTADSLMRNQFDRDALYESELMLERYKSDVNSGMTFPRPVYVAAMMNFFLRLEYTDAIITGKYILSLNPSDPETMELLSRSYFMNGEFKNAMDMQNRLVIMSDAYNCDQGVALRILHGLLAQLQQENSLPLLFAIYNSLADCNMTNIAFSSCMFGSVELQQAFVACSQRMHWQMSPYEFDSMVHRFDQLLLNLIAELEKSKINIIEAETVLLVLSAYQNENIGPLLWKLFLVEDPIVILNVAYARCITNDPHWHESITRLRKRDDLPGALPLMGEIALKPSHLQQSFKVIEKVFKFVHSLTAEDEKRIKRHGKLVGIRDSAPFAISELSDFKAPKVCDDIAELNIYMARDYLNMRLPLMEAIRAILEPLIRLPEPLDGILLEIVYNTLHPRVEAYVTEYIAGVREDHEEFNNLKQMLFFIMGKHKETFGKIVYEMFSYKEGLSSKSYLADLAGGK